MANKQVELPVKTGGENITPSPDKVRSTAWGRESLGANAWDGPSSTERPGDKPAQMGPIAADIARSLNMGDEQAGKKVLFDRGQGDSLDEIIRNGMRGGPGAWATRQVGDAGKSRVVPTAHGVKDANVGGAPRGDVGENLRPVTTGHAGVNSVGTRKPGV